MATFTEVVHWMYELAGTLMFLLGSMQLGSYMHYEHQRNAREKRTLEILEAQAGRPDDEWVRREDYDSLLNSHNVHSVLHVFMLHSADYL